MDPAKQLGGTKAAFTQFWMQNAANPSRSKSSRLAMVMMD